MARCEDNGIDYIFGLSGETGLRRLVDESATSARAARSSANLCCGYAETHYKANSWRLESRVCARIEAIAMASTTASSSPFSTVARPSTSTT
ncbi:hypothetical protein X728_26435 [Mesorhizobium sp. L103C120A0]|nr:hypothetical protein X728_26435 [Mesorhizobium sp. L103C120A0]